jgi:hypothetical protein
MPPEIAVVPPTTPVFSMTIALSLRVAATAAAVMPAAPAPLTFAPPRLRFTSKNTSLSLSKHAQFTFYFLLPYFFTFITAFFPLPY